MPPLIHWVIAACSLAALPVWAGERLAQRPELVEVDGSKLYVETSGSGPPIVFLHGGIHHFDNSFSNQRDDFVASRTVMGVDQRSPGHSPDDPRPFSYGAMVEDTAAVIRHLRLGPVDFVGHSDGADAGLKLARAYPQPVRRLVVSGAHLRAALPPQELQRRLSRTQP